MPGALQGKDGRGVANVAVGDVGLDGKDSHSFPLCYAAYPPTKEKGKLFLRAVLWLAHRRDSAAGNLLVQVGALGGVGKSLGTGGLGLISNTALG